MAISFAVVGSGWVAGEYMKAIAAQPDSELYGVVSSNLEHAKARLTGLGMEARIWTSFDEMIADPHVDAVVLCSTPDVRPDQAILAAQHGKHIVIEKPMAMDKESLWRMADTLVKNPVHTVVSFVLRWNPAFDMAKSLIDDDALGRVFMAQIDYWHHIGPQYAQYRWSRTQSLGGSSILSAGCHAVDAVRYFVGDIEEVTAYSCKTWTNSEYEFDPNAIAIFRLKNGGIGKVSSSLECKTTYKFNIHLLGEKGAIMNNQVFSHKLPGQTEYAVVPTILPDSGDVTHHPFVHEIQDCAESILQHKPTRCDFHDAFKSMEVCFAIDESIATGGKVLLPAAR